MLIDWWVAAVVKWISGLLRPEIYSHFNFDWIGKVKSLSVLRYYHLIRSDFCP